MGNVYTAKPCILVVDDTAINITMMAAILSPEYQVTVAKSGDQALKIAKSGNMPDLILLDIEMPGMDGYQTCEALKSNDVTASVPVIFLTSRNEIEDEKRGFALGAVDYITKPVSPPILLARVKTHLQLKSVRDFLRSKSKYLEEEVVRRTQEIATIQDVTMTALGSLAETRDNETGNHIRRTQYFVKALALELRRKQMQNQALSVEWIERLAKSAPLHDIGKVGIPDTILLKPGKLDPDEFEIMKTHTTLGRNAILTAEKILGTPTSFLTIAREITWSHHERWDGSGYPQGLSGEDIPLAGRLMAVADVYDALINKRVYKPAFSHEKTLELIREGSGTQFDPEIIDVFLKITDQFKVIGQTYSD